MIKYFYKSYSGGIMAQEINLKVIAHIKSSFKEKFAIPRQSGFVENISTIVFEKEFRDENAIRGLSEFSHIWLLWYFSQNADKGWSPTVRPPRLGGNKRMGVFATRSPFRPSPVGLSCVKLISIEKTATDGVVLKVSGSDLLDNTPIIDIKPYLSFCDSHPDAVCGFADDVFFNNLKIIFENDTDKILSQEQNKMLCEILTQNPIPSYHKDKDRIYGMVFEDYNVKFNVSGDTLFVIEILKL